MIEKNSQDQFLIKGSINFNNAPLLLKEACRMIDEKEDKLIFDFSSLEKSNSSGLSVLLSLVRYAKLQHKKIQFLNLPDYLLATAKISDVDKLLPCTQTT